MGGKKDQVTFKKKRGRKKREKGVVVVEGFSEGGNHNQNKQGPIGV